ncbi:hypothetical protein GUITHDRAFT_102423 [Guillardia theta CCMP2712]|uniref:Neurotransmitter-gated ion-channel ligand-binding domain-containing protein n=1 Tax=Guillardia theta (strain CCMP2712) TaxID=905079 RepID=L1JTT5_GUITC|nr:hypothetical protein GUITHDRAFT_102423 [Guillardia theta CCMP2712]EKX51812.1 hypothetical protein GUITHDRAFT_102423 [Guillardia theta CCMP2712]|eukprot:XP_005838792.1 hypothetical protein GUITHDRAFT_102423 [Guillardia theta CCMP2712]
MPVTESAACPAGLATAEYPCGVYSCRDTFGRTRYCNPSRDIFVNLKLAPSYIGVQGCDAQSGRWGSVACIDKFHVETSNSTCSWVKDRTTWTSEQQVYQCNDKTLCNVGSDGWSCCNQHDFIARCPIDIPYMCNNPTLCSDGKDFCCVFAADLCDVPPQNGLRPCNDSYLVKESTCSLDGCAPADSSVCEDVSSSSSFSLNLDDPYQVAMSRYGVDVKCLACLRNGILRRSYSSSSDFNMQILYSPTSAATAGGNALLLSNRSTCLAQKSLCSRVVHEYGIESEAIVIEKEEDCYSGYWNYVQYLADYFASEVPPRMRSAPRDELLGKRTRVEVQVSNVILLGLDLSKETFSSSATVKLTWKDSRLLSSTSNPLGRSVFDVERLKGAILTWRPDLTRTNEEDGGGWAAAPKSVSLNASGAVEEERNFSSSWSCDPLGLWVNQTGIARLRMSWMYPAGALADNSSSSWINDFALALLPPSSLSVRDHTPRHRVIFAHSFTDPQGLHIDLFVQELPSRVALKFVYPVILLILFVLLVASLEPPSPEILGGKFLAFQISLWCVLVVMSIRTFDVSSSLPWLDVFLTCSLTAIVAVALVIVLSSSLWEQQGTQQVVNRKLQQEMRMRSDRRKARMFKWGCLGAIVCVLITSTTSEFLRERARREELPAQVNSFLFDPGAAAACISLGTIGAVCCLGPFTLELLLELISFLRGLTMKVVPASGEGMHAVNVN